MNDKQEDRKHESLWRGLQVRIGMGLGCALALDGSLAVWAGVVFGAKGMLIFAAALAGFTSAGLWLWSALVPIPDQPIRMQAMLDYGVNKDLEKVMSALRWQSTLNKWAALSAAASVALPAIVQSVGL